jgi:RNA polymerase subunit RPABC4/transcription elongation factor Spt4
MVVECPKCGRTIPDDSVYCPYCGYGIKPSSRSAQVWTGGTLIVVAAVASLILFVLSFYALLNIYSWYPPLVAQSWFVYDQLLTVFSFTGCLFGLSAATLSFTRKSYKWTMASSVLCTLSGGGAWIISMIIPHSNPLQSLLYYFLPLFITSLTGTVLIFFRKAEFNRSRNGERI